MAARKETTMSLEFYPMPSFPVLAVGDVQASAEWYQRVLGFQHVFTIPGPMGRPALVHLRWAKYADVLLRQDATDGSPAKGVGISLNYSLFDGGVDELAERARREGARILSEPKDQPWNARDFSVADPDGFRLNFTQGPVKPGLAMDEVIRRASGGPSGSAGPSTNA
jgi:uncharacterized glyoxalase superfamily protein PhnB